MKRKLISFLCLTIGFFSISVSKPLGQFKGYMQIGKNQILITKENFRNADVHSKRKAVNHKIRVLALVNTIFDRSVVQSYGWKFLSQITSDIVELEGPSETAPYLRALDGILYVKMPAPVFACMDTVRKLTQVDKVNGDIPGYLNAAYKGDNVLVGIIDAEFDTHHPAFLDSTGSTRFLAIWDQEDTTGPRSKFGYGTIKTHNQIQTDSNFALNGDEVHGTWVTGMAAGSIVPSNNYYGVAPHSTIIGVKYSQNDNDITNGIKWIFSIADSLHKPCVINMSIGGHTGPHDGTSLTDRIVDSCSGNGKIIVGAAGNDADKRAHVNLTLQANGTKGSWVTPGQIGNNKFASGIEIWGKAGLYFSAAFLVIDTSTMQYTRLQPLISTSITRNYLDTLYWTDTAKSKTDTLIFEALAERQSALNKKVHLEVVMQMSNPNLFLGFNLTNTSRSVDTIHAWNLLKNSFESFNINGYFGGDSTMSINEIGGTAKRIITVGAYKSHLQFVLWDNSLKGTPDNSEHDLTSYSSWGPTTDGRIKPDITAPGSDLVGPLSRLGSDDNVVVWPDQKNKYGRYAFTGGTSVASPVVAGIVALMLQIKPSLSPEEAKQILQSTAIKDEWTGNLLNPDNNWGAGKVNALGAIAKLLGVTVNNKPSNVRKTGEYLNVVLINHNVKLLNCNSTDLQGTAFWYTINGRLIDKQIVGRDRTIPFPQASGEQVFILKLQMKSLEKSLRIVDKEL
jgi:minor extracellular serine protease Vpr